MFSLNYTETVWLFIWFLLFQTGFFVWFIPHTLRKIHTDKQLSDLKENIEINKQQAMVDARSIAGLINERAGNG